MLRSLSIKNYKSILDLQLELGRINVFIGENGCGKSNILEAVAMFAAAVTGKLELDELYGRGIRVARPAITVSSFVGEREAEAIKLSGVSLDGGDSYRCWYALEPIDPEDIFSTWDPDLRSWTINDRQTGEMGLEVGNAFRGMLNDFLIFNLTTKALRGIFAESKKVPLGINGENLDVLIASFKPRDRKKLFEYAQLVSWVAGVLLDPTDKYKLQGHKLGRSTSTLYFKDRFMRQRNNIFSAENANEGILHVLFYGALFISERTPRLFGIDNIETSLNPHLCRSLMKELVKLAAENDKQALITTHNPAILDGLNLHDDEQRLFVVYRGDKGDTKAKRIQLKQKVEVDGQPLKLSELWMRGHLGGLPTNF